MSARAAWLRRSTGDAGSVAIEMVFIAPALVFLLLMVAFGGRVLTAKGEVEGAARDAARAASLSRGDAQADAGAAARQTLQAVGVTCVDFSVALAPSVPQPDQPVRATVTCRTLVSDLGLPGVPGSKTVQATVVSPVDTYVGR